MEKEQNDIKEIKGNDRAKGITIAHQAIDEEHSALIGRICVLLEAIIPDKEQSGAAKKTAKSIIREEQRKLKEYLNIKAWPFDNQIEPEEYKNISSVEPLID